VVGIGFKLDERASMTRKTPQAYGGAPIDLDYAPFDQEATDSILAEVGTSFALAIDRSEFTSRLNGIAQLNRYCNSAAEAPSKSQERTYIADLRRAARTLGNLLPHHAVPGDELEREFGLVPSAGVLRLLAAPLDRQMAIRRATAGAERQQSESSLFDHAETLAGVGVQTPEDVLAITSAVCAILEQAAVSSLESATPAGHPAPSTNEATVTALMRLYRDAFGRRIAFSRPGKGSVPGGPMIRFVCAACRIVGLDPSPNTIAKIKQSHFPAS
jgi:hypothetical protein